MKPYSFQYVSGTERKTGTVIESTDDQAYISIKQYLRYRNGTLVSGSISVLEKREIPDPSGMKSVAKPIFPSDVQVPVKPIAVEYNEAMERARPKNAPE